MSDTSASTPNGAPANRAPWYGHPVWLALGLIAVVLAIYANAIPGTFVYDDVPLVLKNAEIRTLDNVPAIVGFTDEGFRLQKRWTRELSYALEYAAFGPWAPAYHATNVALHALVALLVFGFITRLTQNHWIGWWTALLFAVHPIQTEVVAHVSGRRGLLAATFSLLALLLAAGYARHGGWWRLVLAVPALYLGAFSKEVAVLAPVGFLAIDLLARWRDRGGSLGEVLRGVERRRWVAHATLIVTACILGAAVLFFSTASVGLKGSLSWYETSGAGLGPIHHARLVGLSLRLLAVPIGQSHDYSFDALGMAGGGLGALGVLDVVVLLAGIGLTAFALLRRSWVGIGGVWFGIFLLPHIGIVPWHEIFAERFLYLPSLGFCLAAASVGVGLARQGWARQAAVVGLALAAVLCTGTVLRNEVWSGRIPLWSSAVERYPGCARAHKALADAYVADARATEALEHYQRATEILPNYRDAHVGIAVAELALMDFGKALTTVETLLERWPDDPKAWNLKGYVQQTMGDYAGAKVSYEMAVEKAPRFAEGYNNLARIYLEEGDLDGAIRMYETALQYDPSLLAAYQNLAIVYREGLEDEDKAVYYEAQLERLRRAR